MPNPENIKGKGFDANPENINRKGRAPKKMLTDILKEHLEHDKEIIISGIDVVTGQPASIRVKMPTKENIIQAWLRKATTGDMNAIREILDRTEEPLQHKHKHEVGDTFLNFLKETSS